MKIIRDWKKAKLKRSAIAIGVFDGVHLGHRAILAAAAKEARKQKLLLVALTMDPHPSQVLHPGKRAHLLYSLEHRLELLQDFGVDVTVVLRFDRALASIPAERFVDDILLARLGAKAVAVGTNFRFGQGAKGNADFLKRVGGDPAVGDGSGRKGVAAEKAFAVHVVEPVLYDGKPISSSRIREAVVTGQFKTASKLLGRAYGLFGEVVKGDGLGRKLGFPTVNLRLDHELLPEPGVYAVWAKTKGRAYPGAMHLGPRPTFGSSEPRVECHLLKTPAKDLYGRHFELALVRRVRSVRFFPNSDALAGQITEDVKAVRAALQSSPSRLY